MANKFNPQGRTKFLFVRSLANPTAPTATELAAGTSGVLDLTCGILPNGVEGFATEPSTVDATTMCSKQAETVPGLPTVTDGAFMMARASTTGTDNYALIAELIELADEHAEGYVVGVLEGWADDETGPAVGDVVDVYPVEVASVNPQPLAAGSLASYKVGFTHPGAFRPNVLVANGLSNEVVTVAVGGSGLTSFTLTFDGDTTVSLDDQATANDVEDALEDLDSIGVGNVSVTGPAGGPWVITFVGALAGTNVGTVTATPTGGTGTVTPTVTTAGGA